MERKRKVQVITYREIEEKKGDDLCFQQDCNSWGVGGVRFNVDQGDDPDLTPHIPSYSTKY